jgi:dsDNA-specific endonuclease/ATPase MutS2
MPINWFENNLEIFGHYKNIYLNCSLDGGDKTKWYKSFDVAEINKTYNVNLDLMKKMMKFPTEQDKEYKMEVIWETWKRLGDFTEWIIEKIEELPEESDKRQRNFYKANKIMERTLESICDDIKEAKEVKKEANEIIKEIARKAESPWETEYFEDKNDTWEYKIGYCSLENRVCVEQRC